MKKIISMLVLPVCLTGCTAVREGDIISITERGMGFKVGQAATTQTPEVKFGFFSVTTVFVPTVKSTNNGVASIVSPNFANTFSFGQSSALSLGLDETIASGNYQTLYPSLKGDVSVPTATPIVPK